MRRLGAVAAFCLLGAMAYCEPEGDLRLGADKAVTEKEAPEKPLKQFFFVGTSNYHILLRESEARIDRQLNDTFGLITPDWRNPRTFKDWSEEFLLWDLWFGYGRVLSKHFAWSIYTGGGLGTVPNEHTFHPLLMPVKFKVDFTRMSVLAGTSITWYPFGPPKKQDGFWRNLAASRPMAEANIGYSHQVSIADVKLGLPIVGDAIHIRQKDKYDLLWTSPRLGFETPLTETTSLNILGGYLFFNEHSDEFNGGLLEFFIRHRF